MNAQLTIPQWLGLPIDVRMQLKETFGIPRSQGTHVQDNIVTSDGYTHDDLARITVPAMQVYLNSKETDFFVLFNQVLDELPVLHTETAPIPARSPEVKVTIELDGKTYKAAEEIVVVPKKRGRPAKSK